MTTLVDLRSDDLRGADGAAPHAVALLLHGFGSNERDLAGRRAFLGAHLRPIAA
jgi:predicted esterase